MDDSKRTNPAPPADDDVTVSRRRLFSGAALASAGIMAGCAVTKSSTPPATAAQPPSPKEPVANGIPGPFAGRVIEVHHDGSVANGAIVQAAVGPMLRKAMGDLASADAVTAWKRFFSPGDRVGLKVNCVGHPVSDPKKHAVYTSHELIREVVAALRAIGVNDILLFDRYRMEFQIAQYPEVAKELGIPWDVSAISWDESQIDMEGYSKGDPSAESRNQAARADGSPRVSGYDPEHFVHVDFVHPVHNPTDPRTRRSHLSNIVTKKVDKIINLCLVKDHAAAGVTGALKNLSHGLVDNVCRSHSRSQLNQTATFIPAVLSHPMIRQKCVLNIMEGFRGLYNGGPWASPYLFTPKSLLVSTDPVAMDRVAIAIIDARRAEEGLPPLLKSGAAAAHGEGEGHLFRGTTHVELAGAAGLGVYHTSAEELRRWLGHDPVKLGRDPRVIEHVRSELT
ncbi:MAG: DUF362 domain-containing protein [Deltaproteobacteria bacterium]|nr:DUF362 domain-containing protein [Deltaproteobacteria bacterium]